jgi:radical SAM protein with 4Fe4S-binding SPASM domain
MTRDHAVAPAVPAGPSPTPRAARLRALAREQEIPLSVLVEITGHCNLRCLHCYREFDGPVQSASIATERAVSLMAEVARAGCLSVTLTGGELMTHDGWKAIALAAKHERMIVSLLTNGTLAGDDDIAFLESLRPRRVAVSVYGGTPETHDRVTRTPGSFAVTMQTIRRLRLSGINCRISNVLMRGNFTEFNSVLNLSRELGCEYLAEPNIRARTTGDTQVITDHRITVEQLAEFYSDPDVASGCLEGRLADQKYAVPKQIPGNCSAGITAAFVEATGDVRACVGFGRTFGNVHDSSFEEVWRSSPARLHRVEMRRPLRECSECDLVGLCSQRCPRNADVEDGDANGPSTRACAVAKLLYSMRNHAHDR